MEKLCSWNSSIADRAQACPSARDPHGSEHGLKLWQALIAGSWSLIERRDQDGRPALLLRKHPDGKQQTGLNRLERKVVEYAALGHSNKFITYELNIAPSTVTKYLQSALKKLGLRSRVELIQVLAARRACTETRR